jgi:alanine racemase
LSVNIDLDAAGHNLGLISKHIRGLPVIAVVKADAYGHGAADLSKKFIALGAQSLAVAFVSEAQYLREAGITAPVLVLFDRTDIPSYFDLSLTPVIHDMDTARAFDREAQKRAKRIDVHLKVDTGMGRMGFSSADSTPLMEIIDLKNIRVIGLMSHFADADLDDKQFSLGQIDTFSRTREMLAEKGVTPLCHMANSAASLRLPEAAFDAVRPGLALYGVSPFRNSDYGLRPVMSVRAPVVTLRRLSRGQTISYGRTYTAPRDMTAAVLGVGYADGFSRALSSRAEVIIRGRRAPIVGRVCMDLSVADVTDIEGVVDTDLALLLGTVGSESITAWELAELAGTIPYEILLSMGRMSERKYS